MNIFSYDIFTITKSQGGVANVLDCNIVVNEF